MQSINCAPATQLNTEMNALKQTDRGQYALLVCLTSNNDNNSANMDFDSRQLGRAPYAVKTTIQCIESISGIQLKIQT